jgi:hypothetical protein
MASVDPCPLEDALDLELENVQVGIGEAVNAIGLDQLRCPADDGKRRAPDGRSATAEASAPLAGTSPVKLLWRDEQDTQGNKIGW